VRTINCKPNLNYKRSYQIWDRDWINAGWNGPDLRRTPARPFFGDGLDDRASHLLRSDERKPLNYFLPIVLPPSPYDCSVCCDPHIFFNSDLINVVGTKVLWNWESRGWKWESTPWKTATGGASASILSSWGYPPRRIRKEGNDAPPGGSAKGIWEFGQFDYDQPLSESNSVQCECNSAE